MKETDKREIIIFGAGVQGRRLLEIYGRENVAFFCDNNRAGEMESGIRIISFRELTRIHEDYRVIVASGYYPAARDIGEQLNEQGISWESSLVLSSCMHVIKEGRKLEFITDASLEGWIRHRLCDGTVTMIKDAFDLFPTDKNLDLYIYGGDYASEADECRRLLGLDHIFAYSTTAVLKENVVAVPDYKFYLSGYFETDESGDCDEVYDSIRKDSGEPWKDARAFWGGNIMNSTARYNLMVMSEQFPEKISVVRFYHSQAGFDYGRGNLLKLKEFMKFKYLIDIRGFGWTDRVKLLLAMGRPLLLVYRPFLEYYFDQLVPMKHYVPVKEDLSDLISRITELDEDEELYNTIAASAQEFTREKFSKNQVLKDLVMIVTGEIV